MYFLCGLSQSIDLSASVSSSANQGNSIWQLNIKLLYLKGLVEFLVYSGPSKYVAYYYHSLWEYVQKDLLTADSSMNTFSLSVA